MKEIIWAIFQLEDDLYGGEKGEVFSFSTRERARKFKRVEMLACGALFSPPMKYRLANPKDGEA